MNYFLELEKSSLEEVDRIYFEKRLKDYIAKLFIKFCRDMVSYDYGKFTVKIDSVKKNVTLNIYLPAKTSPTSKAIDNMIRSENSAHCKFETIEIDCEKTYFQERISYYLFTLLESQLYYPHEPKLTYTEIKALKNLFWAIKNFKEMCDYDCRLFSYDKKIILINDFGSK